MYKKDSELNNQRQLICRKPELKKSKQNNTV